MREIEDYISPLVESLFPDFYREEGEFFVLFVKAYYEWLEQNFQTLEIEIPDNFFVGDVITQGLTTGTIVSIFEDNKLLVKLDELDNFRCNTLCNDLTILTSSSGGRSFIEKVENHGVIYKSRHLNDIKDVDRTIDSFLLDFKNKYLSNIQFNTSSNKELFIKNSLDFYRSKGTPRSVDLFFRLIYGLQSKVYYPSDDLFKLSDNEWIELRYLEVEPSVENVNMIGQFIYGSKSKASAFVERLVRVRDGSRFVNVLYLSNLLGNFQTGEQAYTKDLSSNVTTKIVGSLSSFEINSSSNGFEVGERVYVSGGSGKKATAIVDGVESRSGIYNFGLTRGGWGYTSDAEIIGSDRVLDLIDISSTNNSYYTLTEVFDLFEEIVQPVLKFTVENDFDFDQNVYVLDGSNTVFEGRVVQFNSETLELFVNYDNTIYSNTDLLLSTSELYAESNASSSSTNVSNVVSIDATAKVIAASNTYTIEYSGNRSLSNSEVIIQKTPKGGVFANAVVIKVESNTNEGNYVATVQKDQGFFNTDLSFYGNDNEEYTVERISNNYVGIIDVTNTFYNTGLVIGQNTGNKSEVLFYSFGQKADFTIDSFSNEKEIFLSNVTIDTISSNTTIDGYEGYSNTITDTIDFRNVTLGSIKQITTNSSGTDQSTSPFFIVYEPIEGRLETFDWEINISNSDGNFTLGEIITSSNTGAEAEVYISQDNFIRATRTNLNNFEAGDEITGSSSGTSAIIDSVYETRWAKRSGLNSLINTDVQNANGFVTELNVTDSGFGYFQNENVNLVSEKNPSKIISAKVILENQGIGAGYNSNRKSFLSSDKYLHDNVFYQEYSYQILTSIPFEKYKETLINVLHVAGTLPFGGYSTFNESKIEISLNSFASEFEISSDSLYVNNQDFYEHTIS